MKGVNDFKVWSTLFLLTLSFANSKLLANDAMAELTSQLEQAKGKVVYVDFWASWCKPCRKSFPWMNEMLSKYGEQGLTVITVNLDKERKLADQFLAENPASFKVIYDAEGVTAKAFQLKGMPNSFILGRNGEVHSSHVGFNDQKQDEYEAALKQLLSQSH